MMVRSAFWVGCPRAGGEQALEATINNELVPAMRRFPGVSDVKAFWPRKREDNPPDIYCQVVVEFASAADLDLMLSSAERAALRPRVLDAVAMFDGTVSHIDYEAA